MAPSPAVEAPLAPVTPASPAPVPAVEMSEPAPAEAGASPVAEGAVVESPLVGVAYLSPALTSQPLWQLGIRLKGQTLMIIEAMKVMNEVPADRDGVVTEILVANQDVVEFGQGLVRIK